MEINESLHMGGTTLTLLQIKAEMVEESHLTE